MGLFTLKSPFSPQGDQPQAIEQLTAGVRAGARDQVLLGVTGSGKTFTVAKVIDEVERPTLILSHNKTLAAQLYQEFRHFFPENAVEYFVSYYDYYQPEAYVPRSDTYIEKGDQYQRGHRPSATAGDEGPLRASRCDHRGLGLLYLRAGIAAGVLRDADVLRGRR